MKAIAKPLGIGYISSFAVTLMRRLDARLTSQHSVYRLLNLHMILAATLLTLGAVTSYAAPVVTVVVDKPYSTGTDPEVTPALSVTGTWDLSTPGDTQVISLVNWALTLETSTIEVNGTQLYLVSAKAQHLVTSASAEFQGTTVAVNTPGSGVTISAFMDHKPPGDGDYWIFRSIVNPAGTMNVSILASHQINNAIPIAINLAPPSAVALVGTTHTFSATVVDVSDLPIPNVVVTFTVLSGPNAGVNGQGTTDANGVATFSYPGSGGEGVDAIQASFDGGSGIINSNVVDATWQIDTPSVPAISPLGLVILSVLLGFFGGFGTRWWKRSFPH